MPVRRAPNKPVRTTPSQGGRLVTRTSSEVPGFENYTWKHDVRRDLTDEIRREGDDFFRPNMDIPIGNQPFPQSQGFDIAGFANGSFELDSEADGIPDDWAKTVSAGITMSLDTTVYASDGSTQSVKFVSTTSGAEGYLESESELPVTAGRLWRATWKIKASDAAIGVAVRIVWYDEDGAVINDPDGNTEWTIYSSVDNPTTDFLLFAYHATPPVQAVGGRLRFYGKVAAVTTTGSVWFDSVTLDEAEGTSNAITLVHYVRRPNGKAAMIVGTKTTLYRYSSFDNGDYFLRDEDPNYFNEDGPNTPYFLEADEYFDLSTAPGSYFTDTGPGTPYFDSNPGEWIVIGSGFSANGGRWEALNINGYAVFNNGVDLMVTYQEQDTQVFPIYELRESGVVLVGTIWENSGILMGGDVAELRSEIFAENFEHESSGTTKAKQYGSVKSTPTTATIESGVALRSANLGSYVTTPNAASINDWSGGLTVEAMVRISNPSSAPSIAYKGNSFAIFVLANELVLNIGGFQIFSVPFNETGWTHVAVTVDNVNARMYVNANLVAQAALAAVPSDTTAFLYVSDALPGTIDMAYIRLWNVARSQSDLETYMAADPTVVASLKLWHKLDEGTGTSAADSSGNANTGTLTGAPVPSWIAASAPGDSFVKTSIIAASSVSRVVGTVTFVTTTAHHLSVGDLITVSGATETDYNGDFTVLTVADPFTFTYSIGAATPTTPATGSPVVQERFFTLGMVGKFLTFTNGFTTRINGFINGTKVKVDNDAASLTGLNLPFRLYSTSTAQLTGTVSRTSGFATLVGVGTLFTSELSVGQLIRVPNGSGEEVRKVTVITDNTHLTVDANWAATLGGSAVYRVSDFTVLADADIFDTADIGRSIYWPDGSTRKIVGLQNARRVDVNAHTEIAETIFTLENQTAYDAITNASLYDRIQYRAIWGVPDQPRTWAATVPVTISAGSSKVIFSYPVRSLEAGMQVSILGAGTLGEVFTANILIVAPDGQSAILDAAAVTSVTDSLLERTSSIGSIAGYFDLQDDDSSAIIAGKDLRGRTVIYKDTAIFLCDYTGIVATPFTFQRVYQGDDSLYFKNTLINPEGTTHVYAAKTGFFFFDLVNQVPQRAEMFDFIENLFYPVSEIADTADIFSGLCGPTKEVFLMFPNGENGVKGIAFDYRYKTISTLGVGYTAVNTVKKPVPGIPIGVQQDWCVCGDASGTVILYGKGNGPQEQWGGKTAMYNRRGSAYTSTLRGGLFGGGWRELDITGYLPEVSSQGRPNITGITVNLYGFRNPAEAPTLLFSRAVAAPDQNNLIPCFYRRNFLQDEIIIEGANNPFRLAARTVEVGGVDSESVSRRPL